MTSLLWTVCPIEKERDRERDRERETERETQRERETERRTDGTWLDNLRLRAPP